MNGDCPAKATERIVTEGFRIAGRYSEFVLFCSLIAVSTVANGVLLGIGWLGPSFTARTTSVRMRRYCRSAGGWSMLASIYGAIFIALLFLSGADRSWGVAALHTGPGVVG